jgi:hypothetical protein
VHKARILARESILARRHGRGGVAVETGCAFTLLGSAHWQQTTDVNADRWADLAGYPRAIVRRRLFWENGRGAGLFATVGLTAEDREGGTIDGEVVPASSAACLCSSMARILPASSRAVLTAVASTGATPMLDVPRVRPLRWAGIPVTAGNQCHYVSFPP